MPHNVGFKYLQNHCFIKDPHRKSANNFQLANSQVLVFSLFPKDFCIHYLLVFLLQTESRCFILHFLKLTERKWTHFKKYRFPCIAGIPRPTTGYADLLTAIVNQDERFEQLTFVPFDSPKIQNILFCDTLNFFPVKFSSQVLFLRNKTSLVCSAAVNRSTYLD